MVLPEQEVDVRLFPMKNVVFMLCALALFTAGFVSAAHAHIDTQGSDQQIELSADQDNNTDNNAADPMCDMQCAHHFHLSSTGFNQTVFVGGKEVKSNFVTEAIVSSPIYGLKRPPRI